MKFYKCRDCESILILNAPNACCVDGWQELVPNTTDASGEKHVPVIEADGKQVSVKVGSVEHPMLAAHYITCIVLETDRGYQKKELSPGEKPVAHFALTEGETVKAAYEYCNLHGLWKAEG
jgi:superoxide reductase